MSLRSIYQHFVDLEALFAAAQERYTERMADVVRVLPTDGTFEERLDRFVEQRARVLEYLTPARRAAVLQEPFSPQLQEGRNRTVKLGRAEVARMFHTELSRLSEAERADVLFATDMVCTWAAWDTLRLAGLSVEDATRVMRLALAAILDRKGR